MHIGIGNSDSVEYQEEPSWSLSSISKESALDLASILHMDPLDIGRIRLIRGSTDVTLHTSRGDHVQRLFTTTTRSNLKRIPHTITFEGNGYVSSDTVFDHSEREAWGKASTIAAAYEGATASAHVSDRKSNRDAVGYQYDLFIDNPDQAKAMNVVEVYSSMPDFISLEYAHGSARRDHDDEKGTSTNHGDTSNDTDPDSGSVFFERFNNCGLDKLELMHCRIPSTLELGGPLRIKPGGKKAYVGTVKLNTKQLRNGGKLENEDELSLGYLHIRVNDEMLSIAINFIAEYNDNGNNEQNVHAIEERDGDVNSSPSVNNPAVDIEPQILSPALPSPTTSDLLKKVFSKDHLYHCDVKVKKLAAISSQAAQRNVSEDWGKTIVQIPLHRSTIPYLNFGSMTSLDTTKTMGVSVTNNMNFPIRIMHQKIDITIGTNRGEELLTSWRQRTFDADRIRSLSGHSTFLRDFNTSEVIGPGVTLDNIVQVTLKSDIMTANEDERKDRFGGTVILRFGRADQTLQEWKESVSEDPVSAQDLFVELPLAASMLQGRVEYDANQSFFPATVFQATSKVAHDCSHGFDRKLIITNKFSTPQTLRHIKIKSDYIAASDELPSSICSTHFEILGTTKDALTANPGERWNDVVIRYKYIDDSIEKLAEIDGAKKCTVTLGTESAGEFHVPLYIYKGSIIATPEASAIPEQCQRPASLFGADCIFTMSETSDVGTIVGGSIKRIAEPKKKRVFSDDHNHNNWINRIGKYYSNMAEASTMLKESRKGPVHLEPIILSFGVLSAGSTETKFLYVTNHNPNPVNITAATSAVEGMELRLARTAVSASDYIEGTKHEGNASIKKYLLNVQNPTTEYFDEFSHRDDISLVPYASDTLKKLFHDKATVRMYRNGESGSKKNYPLKFHHDRFPDKNVDTTPAPLLISVDHGITCALKYRRDEKIVQLSVPPGGVAKFEVTIRSPTKKALHNHDFAEIITTGIGLTTSSGQFLPVIASYKVLSGSLVMKADRYEDASQGFDSQPFHVPAIFRSMESINKNLQPKTNDMKKMVVENTFSSSIVLRSIHSCNKWFYVSHDGLPKMLKANDNFTTAFRTAISCHSEESGHFPSFYHCALDWLEKKRSIEQGRCTVYSNDNDAWSNHTATRSKAIVDLKRAVKYMDERYGSSGNVAPQTQATTMSENENSQSKGVFNLHSAKGLANNWNALSKLGLNTIRSIVRAHFEVVEGSHLLKGLGYNDTEGAYLISTTFPSTMLHTDLEFPYLSAQIAEFTPTTMGEINKMYIPLKNPSGYPIRVRISRENNPLFFLGSMRSDHWWNGGSYYIPDDRGFLLKSNHNMTVLTPSGSSLGMISPSLHATSALFHGCSGRRCGFKFPSSNGQSPINDEQRLVSPIGAASAIGTKLSGRSYNSDGTLAQVLLNATSNYVDYFALDEGSMREVTIPPHGSVQLGPIFFRPPSRGYYSGFLTLENTLTGYETLKIQGVGVMGKISFFDNSDKANKGSDIEMKHGRTTLTFKTVDIDANGRTVKTVVFGNLGDGPIEVTDIYLKSPTVSQRHSSIPPSNKCSVRGFRLFDCQSDVLDDKESKSFILGADQSRAVHIAYQRDCTLQSTNVLLVLEHKNGKGAFAVPDSELLLSYEMDEDEIRTCQTLPLPWRHRSNERIGTNTSIIVDFLTILLPIVMFLMLLWDIVCSARQRNMSSVTFQNAICLSPKKQTKSKNMGFKNWSSAYRCLSRADPTSAELVQLGKEQSRQMLLNTYRKEGMIQPLCVQSNGAFVRERLGSVANEASRGKAPRRSSNAMSMTLNDAIFSRCILFHEMNNPDSSPIMPCGLGWRVISGMRSKSNSSEARTPRRLSKMKISETKAVPRRELSKPLESNISECQLRSSTAVAVVDTGGVISDVKDTKKELQKNVKSTRNRSIMDRPDVKGDRAPAEILPQSVEAPEIRSENRGFHKDESMAQQSTTLGNNGTASQSSAGSLNSSREMKENKIQFDLERDVKRDNLPVEGDISLKHNSNTSMLLESQPIAVSESDDSIKSESQQGSAVEVEVCAEKESIQARSQLNSDHKLHIETCAQQEPVLVEEPVLAEEPNNSKSSLNFEAEQVSNKGETNSDDARTKEPRVESTIPSKNTAEEKSRKENTNLETGRGKKEPSTQSPNRKSKTKLANKKKHDSSASTPNKKKSTKMRVKINVSESDRPSPSDSSSNATTNSKRIRKKNVKTDDKISSTEGMCTEVVTVQRSPCRKNEKLKNRRKTKKSCTKDKKHSETCALETDSKNTNTEDTYKQQHRPTLQNFKEYDFSHGSLSGSNRTLISSEDSEESSVPTISPNPETGISNFRPPPGLAPPPGFANEDLNDNILVDDQEVKGDAILALHSNKNTADNSLLAKLLDEKNALLLDPLNRNLGEEESPSSHNLLMGAGQDLNVMNILTFLDESMDNSNFADDDDERQLEDANFEPLALYGSLGTGVGSNPWSDSRPPRAFAYGFGVERNTDESNTEGDTAEPPLLTPSLFLGHHGGGESDTEQDNGAAFDADAFFSDLLE